MSADRDARDPALDALLREHSAETPPAHLDAAIRAAARRAVASAPRDLGRALARQPWRWWMPLAAAAAIGVIVIGVLPLAPTTPENPPVVSDAVPEAPRDRGGATDAERARQPAAAGATNDSHAARLPEPKPAVPDSSRPDAFPARDAQRKADAAPAIAGKREGPHAAPAPQAESSAAGRPETAQKLQPASPAPVPGQDATPRAPQGRIAPSPPPASAPALEAPSLPSLQRSLSDPQAARRSAMGEARADRALEPALSGNAAEWIARIRALQGEGRLAEATRELARFRETFADADARLPSDLRAWSESLPR